MAYDRYDDNDLRARDENRSGSRDPSRREGRFFRGGREERDDSHRREPRGRDPQEPRFGREGKRSGAIPTDETRDLIASNKVEGTPVYGRDDQRLGTVKTLMIDKYKGQVRFAVLSHASGFLGLDERFLPVQWDELRYDDRRGGYRVNFTGEDVAYTLDRRERERAQGRDLDRSARLREDDRRS